MTPPCYSLQRGVFGFPRNESETQLKENGSHWHLYTRSCCLSTKNGFIKEKFCRQKRITEKGRPTPKPNSLTAASKVFMRHFKDCIYEWLTAGTSYLVGRFYFLIRVKGHWMTDTWTLFTSDRWVLHYLMSIVSCTLLWRFKWYVDNTVVWCVDVQFCCFWVCHHFRVTWMCIVTCVLGITFTDHVGKFTLHLTHPNLAYC